MDLYGPEKEDISGFDTHTQYLWDAFIVGLALAFVDKKKIIKYPQPPCVFVTLNHGWVCFTSE